MRKIIHLIILSILLIPNTYSQDNIDYIIGYQRQHYNVLELGIAISKRDEFKTYRNFHICGEFLFGHSERSMIGLKTGMDFSYAVFIFSGQAAYCFNRNDKVFHLRPEVGFTVFGFADLTYGYNLFLQRENLNMVNNVLSIRFKMPFSLYY